MKPETKRIIYGFAAAIVALYVLVYFLDKQAFNTITPFIDTDPSDCCKQDLREQSK
ncbi:MAG: hypothetical protein JKY46_11205 [Robiginitomaculum sp.]|nr:hypothetical protein [Robiginitomaculum sp.]